MRGGGVGGAPESLGRSEGYDRRNSSITTMITSAVGGAGGSVSKTARGRTVSIGDDVGNS
jgi:hypothetical protein